LPLEREQASLRPRWPSPKRAWLDVRKAMERFRKDDGLNRVFIRRHPEGVLKFRETLAKTNFE